MKTCTKCGQPKPAERFAIDRAKRDGRDSWCRDCRNEARRDRYRAHLDRERQRSRDYYDHAVRADPARCAARRARSSRYYTEHREAILAAYRNGNRQQAARPYDPAKERVKYMKRHGGVEEWARMWDEQGGCCYLCGETLEGVPQKMIAVDHDHECHPSTRARTESCSDCRRGLTHAWCNQLIGLAGEDMDVLRAIIANFERVNAVTKARIAVRPYVQAALGVDVRGASEEAYSQPMPDLDMAVGVPWPESADDALF